MNIPPNGATVLIVRKPRMSWLRDGDVVRVTYRKNVCKSDDVHAVAQDGSGTFDRAKAWDCAVWEIAS